MSPSSCDRTTEQLLHWLALRLTPGLGARKTSLLLEHFGSPEAIFRASTSELEAAGLAGSVARSISSGCAFEDAAEQQDQLTATGTQVVAFTDALYPPQLRQIYDPPPLLFVQGRLELLDTVMVALVGSRRPSTYGMVAAEHLAIDLAKAGVTVVSGMAKGIDTAAHLGALKAGGGTVAVFGCGLDIIYPAENRKLAARIATEGLLMSEFPLGTPAHPQNFPIRNRVVSGLSDGVVVVEGVQYSGSLITARLALDQNKEVFAVPGNITSKLSFGPNLLLKQGAQLVQSATDILDGLSWETRSKLARQGELPMEEATAEPAGPMAQLAKQILSFLSVDTPLHLDALLEHLLDCSPSEVIATLFELELRGQVRQLPGRSYVKVWYE
ncbi:DNA-processing protein DprA [uncultured Paludibaculum sp.]|uniref:DNA-processing protein DprA n=1 Tax=uncultured Paludibaculum sp. TaxID=1765020 RepID=UPI002AABAE49|nr:DNA-processing protein DprA [uncultured Paludibaculum sp.]